MRLRRHFRISPRGAWSLAGRSAGVSKVVYAVAVAATFDPDDYELRWPPQLFADELDRLQGRRPDMLSGLLGRSDTWADDTEWLLTEAFVSTAPADVFNRVKSSGGWGGRQQPSAEQWVSQLARQASKWPEPGTRKPYWSARGVRRPSPARMEFDEVTRNFVQLVDDLKAHGYLVQAFGKECVDDDGPLPDPSAVLSARLGYAFSGWPLDPAGWTPDDFFDLVEVVHDVVARPSSRWLHDFSGCGWHYSAFVTGPARRLYRWRINHLLAASTLGVRLADNGEDLGRLIRVEPTGLGDLSEQALSSSSPESADRVRHAIALFRSRNASVEERRSAVITLAGILEERRDLLKAELLTKDEGALFQIANAFAIRHQRDDQQSDYDGAFLDWLYWWYLGTVELTNQLLGRQASRPT
jgi:hypothetical protein